MWTSGAFAVHSFGFLLTQVGFRSQRWCIEHLTFSTCRAGILFFFFLFFLFFSAASSHRPSEQFPHTVAPYAANIKRTKDIKLCSIHTRSASSHPDHNPQHLLFVSTASRQTWELVVFYAISRMGLAEGNEPKETFLTHVKPKQTKPPLGQRNSHQLLTAVISALTLCHLRTKLTPLTWAWHSHHATGIRFTPRLTQCP